MSAATGRRAASSRSCRAQPLRRDRSSARALLVLIGSWIGDFHEALGTRRRAKAVACVELRRIGRRERETPKAFELGMAENRLDERLADPASTPGREDEDIAQMGESSAIRDDPCKS